MKRYIPVYYLLLIALISLVGCEKSNLKPKPDVDNDLLVVSQFVYDGMSAYYLWDNEVVDKKPTEQDIDPEKYFYSLLSETDTEHGWSWITDDIESLMKGFAGEAVDEFGFNVLSMWFDDEHTQIVGVIRYVYANTPADAAGFKRGQVITHINGEKMTLDNYMVMHGSNKSETFTVLDQNLENPVDITVSPASFDANTVLHYDVIEEQAIDGQTHKIGYLFYTGFRPQFNQDLIEAFNYFQSENIDDLVVDLRYNLGGSISAAAYLASLIAPRAEVQNKSVLSIMSYNDFVNEQYDKNEWARSTHMGGFSEGETDPLSANSDLGKVYIIAQRSSASASELLTFCLRPYMDVVHIGEKTAGKYTASWTVHAYDNFAIGSQARAQTIYNAKKLPDKFKAVLKNWGMQPIVGRYTDANGTDFIDNNGLLPDYMIESQEYNPGTWKPIGDPEDYLLAKAISLITGNPYASQQTRSVEALGKFDFNLMKVADKIAREAVIMDTPQLLPPLETIFIEE